MNDRHYSLNIIWSEEDNAYLAQIPELPGCAADGATVEEVIANIRTVMEEWIETATELRRPVPEPMTLGKYAEEMQKSERAMQAKFVAAVQKKATELVA